MVTTAGLLEAYFDCRHRKRKTASAIVYEMDYESVQLIKRYRQRSITIQRIRD